MKNKGRKSRDTLLSCKLLWSKCNCCNIPIQKLRNRLHLRSSQQFNKAELGLLQFSTLPYTTTRQQGYFHTLNFKKKFVPRSLNFCVNVTGDNVSHKQLSRVPSSAHIGIKQNEEFWLLEGEGGRGNVLLGLFLWIIWYISPAGNFLSSAHKLCIKCNLKGTVPWI